MNSINWAAWETISRITGGYKSYLTAHEAKSLTPKEIKEINEAIELALNTLDLVAVKFDVARGRAR